MNPSSVEIYIVNDRSLNAFVAGGQKLFLHTGFLARADSPEQIIGVIAHEAGHIAGGHLARANEAMSNASARTILGYVLGAAAAIGTGRPDLGAAVVMGSQDAGMRSFLQYSRAEESAADQAAVNILNGTDQSPEGLLQFMEILSGQELLTSARQDPYVRSHPLTSERIEFLRNQAATSPNKGQQLSPQHQALFERMKAKLKAFLDPVSHTLRTFKETDTSIPARYARAIAYYRRPDMKEALPLIDGLIAERPEDPFFHELRGQVLFENARPEEALASYEKAVELFPGSALLRQGLAQVQLELNRPELLAPAVENLKIAIAADPDNAFLWRQMAIGYGRQGDMGLSALAMAEEAFIKRENEAAKYHAGKAEQLVPRGSPEWLRAQDILGAVANRKDDK